MQPDISQFECIIVEERDALTIVKLNRPDKLNARNAQLEAELLAYIRSLSDGEYRPRALVLTGEGRAFCAGADVGDMASTDGERPPFRRPHAENHTLLAMRNCDVPIIGAINGYAVGMGFGLALGTDVRICNESAIFQVAQTKRGIMADFGLPFLLTQALGTQRALELMFTGRRVDAEEALRLGLVLDVVPDDQLLRRALDLAAEIAKGPPIGAASTKQVVYAAEEPTLVDSIKSNINFVYQLFSTEDSAEGVRSFIERREPEFRGR